MTIQDWHKDRRPREKLLSGGASQLSDAELLALFIRTGVPGLDAVALSQKLLDKFGTLNAIFNAKLGELSEVKGIGQAKFVLFQAILEISKRYFHEAMTDKDVMQSPDAVRKYLQHLLQNEPYEQFVLLHLDNQHRVLKSEVLFKGTINAAAVYPRVVVDSVIQHRSAAVIFAHNHPSGICEPSQADIQLTKRLKQALNLIDVATLDHFVVGQDQVVSFAERGLI